MSSGGAQFYTVGPFFDASGAIYRGIKVTHYAAGTTTDKTVWTDEGKTTAAAQPVVDSNNDGIVTFFADGMYRLQVTQSDNTALAYPVDWDNIRITADTATMYESNRGTAYPSAGSVSTGHLFAVTQTNSTFVKMGFNDGGSFATLLEMTPTYSHNKFPGIIVKSPWVDLLNYATGDGVTDDTAAINSAMTEAVNQKHRNIMVPGGYTFNHTGFTLNASHSYLRLWSPAGVTQAIFNNTSATADTFSVSSGTEPDSMSFENIYFRSTALTTGAVFRCLNLSTQPVRDLHFTRCVLNEHKFGMVVYGGLNLHIKGEGNRASGQGTGVVGGVGFQFGDTASYSTNYVVLSSWYIAAYETDIHVKAAEVRVRDCIVGASKKGIIVESGKICKTDNCRFENIITTPVDNKGGYFFWDASRDSTGSYPLYDVAKRTYYRGHYYPNVSVYSSVNRTITNNTQTTVAFNTEDHDGELTYDTSTYRYTAPFGTWHEVKIDLPVLGSVVGEVELRLIKNGGGTPVVVARNFVNVLIASRSNLTLQTSVWLDEFDTLEAAVFHTLGAGETATITGGAGYARMYVNFTS